MSQETKKLLIIIGCLFIGGGSLALGALTAPQTPESPQVSQQPQQSTQPPQKQPEPSKTPEISPLDKELPTVTAVLSAAYPKATTDYTMQSPKLFEDGRYFGALLSYKGTDTLNRDTLRVLMEKKDGEWILRSAPPEPLLSAKKYKDVPVAVLKALNQPVSLPGSE